MTQDSKSLEKLLPHLTGTSSSSSSNGSRSNGSRNVDNGSSGNGSGKLSGGGGGGGIADSASVSFPALQSLCPADLL
jgi:hypothetical protein